jgi:hypothetical protein
MLETLRMVRGAIADRPVVQALTHFYVYDGRIQGSNSRMAIDAPIPLEGTFVVPGERFVQAIDRCEGEPTLTAGDGHVRIRDGAFRVKLPTLETNAFPVTLPDPLAWETEEPVLPTVRELLPFVASDANQVWPLGLWIDERFAYATNNVIVLRRPTSFFAGTGAKANVPAWALEELARIGLEPIGFGVSENSLTFYLPGGAWIKTQLVDVAWPIAVLDGLYRQHFSKKTKLPKIQKGLVQALDRILPFCENPKFPVIVTSADKISTEDGLSSAEVEGFALPDGKFNGVMLRLALASAVTLKIDHPHTIFMTESGAHGIMTGLRQ